MQEISDSLDAGGILRSLTAKRNDNPTQFQKDLSESNSPAMNDFWDKSHRTAMKNVVSVESCNDIPTQLTGIDAWITIKSSDGEYKTISAEHKADWTEYTNLAFEIWSTEGATKGWAEKAQASDIFVYAFPARGVAYYFMTQEFIGMWKDNATQWKQQFGERKVWSSRAIVCPVPLKVIMANCNCKVVPTSPLQRNAIQLDDNHASNDLPHNQFTEIQGVCWSNGQYLHDTTKR